MNRRTVPRILTRVAIVTMVVSAIGFVASLLLNMFVFDKYDVYGEVPMAGPSSSTHHLPAGYVGVYLHTVLDGGSGNITLPPDLQVRIHLPKGDESMREDQGGSAGDDAYLQIGHLDVPAEDDYEIKAAGDMKGYEQAKLAFANPSSYDILPLAFGIAFGLAVLLLLIARVWAARVRPVPVPVPVLGQQPRPAVAVGSVPPRPAGDYVSPQQAAPTLPNVPTQQAAPPQQAAPMQQAVPNVPTQQTAPTVPIVPPQQPAPTPQAESASDGTREGILNTLAQLRDSGALTEEEYQAEKERVLEGR